MAMIEEHGWPGNSLVGEDGSHAAWFILQHSIERPDLQRRCLPLLSTAVANGEAAPAQAATSGVFALAEARARRAWLATERGTARAAECTAMALDALHDGTLLEAASHTPAYHRCVGVLIMSDAAEEARDAIAALRWRAPAAAAWYDSELSLRTGDLGGAEQHAGEALTLAGEAAGSFVGAMRVLVCALAERGAFADAHDVLRWIPPDSTAFLRARTRLLTAAARSEEAYAAALELGARSDRAAGRDRGGGDRP